MTALAEEDEPFSELVDATFPRIDLVKAGANGFPRFLIAKANASVGLLEPEFVRDLIAKAPHDTTTEGPVTGSSTRERAVTPNGIVLSGSSEGVADFMARIHKAAVDAREQDGAEVAKADMSTKSLNDLPDSAFAYIEGGGTKDDEGKTTPRSLRHFAIHDKAHADNAAARIAQGAKFGDKALPKVGAAQKRFGEKDVSKEADVAPVAKDLMDAAGDATSLDGGMDGMDPTVPLAAPCDEDVPGDPTDPGSPAWEAIDAATAMKWTSIASRLRNVLGILAEREMLEAASADPSDAENAMDLQDAECVMDYVIGTLAVFAAGEQAEAEIGAEMEAIGKALAWFDPSPLSVIEGLTEVRKAGRVLSAANEAKIRDAAKALGDVLASLPSAPQAETVTKEKEAAMAATATAQAPAATVAKADRTPEEQARDTGPVQAGGTTGMGLPRVTGPDAALPADGPQQARPGDVPGRQVIKASLRVAVYDHRGALAGIVDPSAIAQRVAKADGDDGAKASMQAVFDQDGDLIGICDPADITPVSGAGGGKDDMQPGPAAAAADDMTPQPAASAGTPADAVGKSAGEDVITVTQDLERIITKAVAAALGAAAPAQDVAKQADVAGALAKVDALEARLATVEKHPAAPGVFTNGAVPPQDARPLPGAAQLRGQDQGGAYPRVDVAKALARKQALYGAAGAPEQDRIFKEMQGDAVDALAAIHAAGRR